MGAGMLWLSILDENHFGKSLVQMFKFRGMSTRERLV